MAQGKFSNPRPHRDEERQIEQAFRQVTGQGSATQTVTPALTEDAQLEQTIHQVTQQAPTSDPAVSPASPAPQQEPAAPNQEAFDPLSQDGTAFFGNDFPSFEEDPEESEPDFIDNAMAFFQKAAAYCKKNQKVVTAGVCAGALLLIVVFIGIFFASGSDPYDDKILENVYIADVNVGGMTKSDAISAVKLATNSTYTGQDMVIDLSGTELHLSPKDTKAELDVKAAVNAAYDYGRTGTKSEQEQALTLSRTESHIIGVLPYLELDTDYIKDTLTDYAEDSGSTLTQANYGLEGTTPELSADKFDEKAPTQTLVITLGTPGVGFDVNDVYNQVLDAYSLHVFLVEVEDVESVKEPDPVDLEAIYEEFYIEPVNATVNLQNFKTQPGSYGYGFDLEAARKLIEKADYGEEVRIPMEYIAPDILDDDSFFHDTLGEYRTRTTGNNNRNANLRLACEAINETVLNPGETLSFSSALGNVRGYQSAPEDTGREETSQGGVSQVASTLYHAALLSDLEIVSRSNHGYVPSFIEYGMDATSSLKIKNSTGFPIRIEAEVSGGYVVVRIIGTEERDYYIVMDYTISNTYQPETEYEDFAYNNKEGYDDGDVIEEGTAGYLVKTYKIKYDSESGKQLSKDFVTNSQYPAQSRVLARVEPEPTTEPTTEATEAPTETTKPTETTAPPTETTQPTTAPTTEPTTEPTTAPTSAPTTEPSTAPTTEPTASSDVAQEQVVDNDVEVSESSDIPAE